MLITVNCGTGSCFIARDVLDAGGNTIDSGMLAGTSTAGYGVNCLDVDSAYQFKIGVSEARGAVTATFSTSYHREMGLVDKAISAPPSFAINGGRPF